MKKQFTIPVIEVLKFASEDVILTVSDDSTAGDIEVDDIWGNKRDSI